MKKFWAAAFALALTAACSEAGGSFSGKEYKLLEAPENAEITIAFDEEEPKFYGQSAVNRYFGSYKLDGTKLIFGPIGSTMMAGPQNMMKAESIYLQFLPEVVGYKLEGKSLTLVNKEGKELVFEEVGSTPAEAE